MTKILYITYDGLTDPLGQSQIIPYLTRLSDLNNSIHIISYEKKNNYLANIDYTNKLLQDSGIVWHKLWYSSRPPLISTILNLFTGYKLARRIYNTHAFSIVHCRGYVASIIGLRLKNKLGIKYIFDMRGWWPDEKRESGLWNNSIYKIVYWYFKKLEKIFFSTADYIVSLTFRGKEAIISLGVSNHNKIGVIPTCVNFNVFPLSNLRDKHFNRAKIGIRFDENVFLYSGSLGGNYNPSILLEVFNAYIKVYATAYLLILSKDPVPPEIFSFFKSNLSNRFSIHSVRYNEVPQFLSSADIGFIFYNQSFSVIGRSPTKLGEYWASGLPVISFKGIGDLDTIFEKYNGGGLLLSNEKDNWAAEIQGFNRAHPNDLRSFSEDFFHLNRGVTFYNQLYEHLLT